MSTTTQRVLGSRGFLTAFRWWAMTGAGIVTLVYLSVLFHVVNVVGGSLGILVFTLEVIASLGLAVALSKTVTSKQAVLLGSFLLIGGLAGYLLTVPGATIAIGRQLSDTIALITGLSVLRMTRAGIWVLGFTPGPLFVSWYFVLRRRYALAALIGGATIAFFLSTGDLDTVQGLIGMLGVIMLVGFGRLDIDDGPIAQRNAVVTIIIATLVVTTSISLVPGGQAQPLLPERGSSTIEANLLEANDEIEILGSIKLSPEVRFTVTADEAAYWRVDAYDRYTGSGWVRTGDTAAYSGPLPPPEGDKQVTIRQTFEAESTATVMPAAWKPVRVGVGADRTRVSEMEGLRPAGRLSEDFQYSVESIRNDPSEADLRRAGTDYPDDIQARFVQLPESTPDRVGSFTADLTANADTPYDTARVIEQWLENNKEYSLSVDRPDGDIAAAFLFEMDRGYCTYYATTMVTMLRSQGIPARLTVGYTPGQQVADNRWVVRGLDSHAWVEVYFPGEGWVQFDPTPAGPREDAEATRLNQARVNEVAAADTNLSIENDSVSDPTPIASPDVNDSPQREPTVTAAFEPDTDDEDDDDATTGSPLFSGELPSPTREEALYGLILFLGALTAAYRTGLVRRGYRWLWLRRDPTGTPPEQVAGAYQRVEQVLETRHRSRRPTETPREFLAEIRRRSTITGLSGAGTYEQLDRLLLLFERAHYGGTATTADAAEALRILNSVREDRESRWPWR